MSNAPSEYASKTKQSGILYERAKLVLAGGVSHNARYYQPYPIFVKKAQGKNLWDVDGNRFTDYWLGHTALILGHSPKVVVDALHDQIGNGTLFGVGSETAIELAEEIGKAMPTAEMSRFCNSGGEATTYLVRLARGYTRKRVVVKMEGGWHGFGGQFNVSKKDQAKAPTPPGLLPEEQAYSVTAPFNDIQVTEKIIKDHKDDLAAVFLEPVMGSAGVIPADVEYLKTLRELTVRYGAILAFDEIVTGFRLALGGAQEFYGVYPDLSTEAKVVGGGLPIGVVSGRKEIVSLADPTTKDKSKLVPIGGGTFSENELTMVAGLATLRHLRKNRDTIYPYLNNLGNQLRTRVDAALQREGVTAHSTGVGSIFSTHFSPKTPKSASDVVVADKAIQYQFCLSLMAEGDVFLLPGHSAALSTEHGEKDVEHFAALAAKIGGKLRPMTQTA